MEKLLHIELSLSDGTVLAHPSPDTIQLQPNDLLVVSMSLESGLTIPHLLRSEYDRQGTTGVFAIGSGESMAPGIEFAAFQVNYFGGFPGISAVHLSGLVTDPSNVVQPWSIDFELELDDENETASLPSSAIEALQNPPAGPMEFSIEVKKNAYNPIFPEASSSDPNPGPLHVGQLMILQVAAAGPGVANAGFTEISYFEFEGGRKLCSLSWGTDLAPAGLVMSKFAFRNSGALSHEAFYTLTFRGTVQLDEHVRLWSFDPEIILRTSGGPPLCT